MEDFRPNQHVFSLSTLRTVLFHTFADIAPPLQASKSSSSLLCIVYRVSFQFLHLLNLLSLVFPLAYSAKGYNSQSVVWRVIGYSRYDAVLVALGSEQSALLVAYCLTLTPFALLVVSAAAKVLFPALRLTVLKHALRISLLLLDEALIIPTATVLWTGLFGPLLSPDFTYIYPNYVPGALGSATNSWLSLAALTCLIVLLFLQRNMLFDICWLNSNSTLFARYTASAHVRAVLVNISLCGSTLLWRWQLYNAQSAVCALAALSLTWRFTSVMPFYNKLIACVVPIKYLIVASAVGERYLGEYLESENTAWTLLFCISPMLVVGYWQVYGWRMAQVSGRSLTKRNFQLLVLKKLQKAPADSAHEEIMQLFLSAKAKFGNKPQVCLLESLYFLLTKGNSEVAQLKASLCPATFSLQYSFLRFRILAQIATLAPNDKNRYVFFNTEFSTVKKCDEYFCLKYADLLSEVACWSNNDLTTSVELFSHSLVDLEGKYANMLKNYPHDATVLTTFAEFLTKMKRDDERGKEISKKADIMKKNSNKGLFDLSDPLFICQATGSRRIIFANPTFKQLISPENEQFPLEDLDSLLHPSLRAAHSKAIPLLLSSCDTTTYTHNDVFLCVQGIKGVLVNLRAELIAVGGRAYMIVSVQPRENYIAVGAVVDGNLVFHTEDFLKVMGCEACPTCPVPMADMIPGYDPLSGIVTLTAGRGRMETTRREVAIGSLKYSLIETFNFKRRSKARKETLEPSLQGSPTRLWSLKPLETREVEAVSTKAVTSTAGNYREKDSQRRRQRAILRLTNLLIFIVGAQVLLLILESFLMFALYFQVVDEMDSVDSINELGARRNLDVRIVMHARQLELMSHGYAFLDSESSVRSNLQAAISAYLDIVENIRENCTSWVDGTSADMYTQRVVPIWTLTAGKSDISHVSLMDAMSNFLLRAGMLANSDLQSLHREDLFYVFQNGLGPTFDFLNSSTFLYVQEMQSSQLTKAAHLHYISIFLVVGTTILAGALVALVLWQLEKRYEECWEIIINASTGTVQRLWDGVRNRLEFIHGLDTIAIPPKKQKYTKKYTRRYQKVALVICIFALCSVSYFTFVYITADNYVSQTMVTKANYMNWAGLRRALCSLLSTLIIENYMNATSQYGYFSIVNEGQIFKNLQERISAAAYALHKAERITTLGDSDFHVSEVTMSAAHSAFLFSNSCSLLNLTTCTHTALAKGVHLGLIDLLTSLKTLTAAIADETATWPQVQKMTTTGLNVGNAFVKAAELFNIDSSQTLERFRGTLWTYPGGYLAAALLVYPLILLPVKTRYKDSLMAVWRASSLFLRE